MEKPINELKLLVAFAAIFASACGAAGSSFKREEISKNESAIYVYRVEDDCLSDKAPEVLLDDRKIGVLKNGGYLFVQVEPKVHTIKISSGENLDVGIYVDPGQGEERFVKWAPVCQAVAGTATFRSNLNEVESETALLEISSTSLSR